MPSLSDEVLLPSDVRQKINAFVEVLNKVNFSSFFISAQKEHSTKDT
jgi:hypothetical protein